MAWFALARVLFIVAVAYAAADLQPVPVGVPANVGFALVLAALVLAFERGLRETAVTRIFGALIGGAIGLAMARGIGAGLFWANTGDRRVPDWDFVDVRVEKDFDLGRGVKIGAFMDVLNLTNSDPNESVGSQQVDNESFGLPVSYVIPRRIMLGAKIKF